MQLHNIVKATFHVESKKINKNSLYLNVADVIYGSVSYQDITKLLTEAASSGSIQSEDINEGLRNYSKLKEILNIELPIIDYSNDSMKSAMHLFIRFNSGGVKLRRAELAMANLAITVPSLIRACLELTV